MDHIENKVNTSEKHILPILGNGISGSCLKVLAVVTMVLDHFAMVFLQDLPAANAGYFYILGFSVSLYSLIRGIGRLAFPIYCFLLLEGMKHTRDRFRYGQTLLVFAVISEVPWDLAHGGFSLATQNVFFTLFLGYCCVWLMEKHKDSYWKTLLSYAGMCLVAVFARADYGCYGLLFIALMYLFERCMPIQALSALLFLNNGPMAALAFLPISQYNGERGFIRGTKLKYGFYIIYPAHLLLFAALKGVINL